MRKALLDRLTSLLKGLFATLCGLLGGKGSGAPKIGLASGAPKLGLIGMLCMTLGLVSLNAASAQGEALKPWWHITSGSRPSYIAPGTAQSEVQTLSWHAGRGHFVRGTPRRA